MLGIFGITMNIMVKLTTMVINEPKMLINGFRTDLLKTHKARLSINFTTRALFCLKII